MIDFSDVKKWNIGNREVKQARLNGVVVWTKKDYTEPFYVKNTSGSTQKIKISRDISSNLSITVQKSTDGVNWDTWGTIGGNASVNIPLTYNLSNGQKLYLRANTETWCDASQQGIYETYINGMSEVGGNILSLLYGSNFTGNETSLRGENYTFSSLFSGNTSLVSAGNLILPKNTTQHCYSHMFSGCSLLKSAPALPATSLARFCYYGMFEWCSSLIVAPYLPATTLTMYCYYNMFYNCTSLKRIVCNAVDVSAQACTMSWLYNVNQTGIFYKSPSAISWSSGTSGIPSGWTVQNL